MSRHPGELPIPYPAEDDPKARELARVWHSGETLQMTLQPDLWDDPGAWGIVLVDLANLIAEAYDKSGEMESAKALALIRQIFDAEWNHPTDFPQECPIQ
jgi:hypothetical protein